MTPPKLIDRLLKYPSLTCEEAAARILELEVERNIIAQVVEAATIERCLSELGKLKARTGTINGQMTLDVAMVWLTRRLQVASLWDGQSTKAPGKVAD